MKPAISGTARDATFIIYEHGVGSLFAHLKARKRLNESKVKTIAAELCLALKHLHVENLMFPCLRPENIFLTPEGHVRLVDLWHNSGMAKKAHVKDDVTEYLTPEFLDGQKDDQISDWWRLGVLLYELICGIPPFYSLQHDRKEILDKIKRHEELLPSLQFPKDATPSTKRFIQELLSPYHLRKRFMDWSSLESDPFFSSVDFDGLWRREEAEAKSRKVERRKMHTPKYDIRVSLLGARDLSFGEPSDQKSISLGIKADCERTGHTTAPVASMSYDIFYRLLKTIVPFFIMWRIGTLYIHFA